VRIAVRAVLAGATKFAHRVRLGITTAGFAGLGRQQTALLQRCRALVCAVAFVCGTLPAAAQAPSLEQRPYDDKLLRLSEILGAVHFLRELCGNNDGMLWRERMVELIEAESSSALRRVRLTRAFNSGYLSYSRTYSSCTPTAQTSIVKFMAEGAEIAETLVKNVP
jgi:uncharacterized protein (TIGR02301 family)